MQVALVEKANVIFSLKINMNRRDRAAQGHGEISKSPCLPVFVSLCFKKFYFIKYLTTRILIVSDPKQLFQNP